MEEELCKIIRKNVQHYSALGKLDITRIYHINNGEHSGNKTQRIIAGKKAKLMGQQKGFLDYICFRDDGSVFFIEVKVRYNKPEPEQESFIEMQESLGNKCYVVRAKKREDFAAACDNFDTILKKEGLLRN